MELIDPDAALHLRVAGISQVISSAQLKLSVLAQSCLCPGWSAVVANLLESRAAIPPQARRHFALSGKGASCVFFFHAAIYARFCGRRLGNGHTTLIAPYVACPLCEVKRHRVGVVRRRGTTWASPVAVPCLFWFCLCTWRYSFRFRETHACVSTLASYAHGASPRVCTVHRLLASISGDVGIGL